MSLTLQSGQKFIMAVAFGNSLGKGSSIMYAAYKDGVLGVVKEQEILVAPDEWVGRMLEDVEEKLSKGWVCLIEDKTASFRTDAILYDFDALNDDGRTNLQTALDWYFALQARGGIVLKEGTERLALNLGGETDKLEADHDTKGRLIYRIDWTRLKAAHRALLMCVAGAVQEEPLSEQWMRAIAGNYPRAPRPPMYKIFKAFKEDDERRHLEFELACAKRRGDDVLY